MAAPDRNGALSHIRVLDLSRVLAGPWASQILGDLGAEVLKIERPGAGDDTRGWGPPYASSADGSAREAAYFLTTNRNKQSVAIDMGTAEGAALIRRLAAECDVVIENFKVGGLKKYGLDWASLQAVNPRLIYCSITGFGQTGPYAPRAGYDFMIQAMGGLMSVTGEPDTVPGGGPVKVGVALVDVMTGLYATIGVLAALAHRDQGGAGQHIDLALLDVSVATLANQAMNFLVAGTAPGRMGNAHPNIVPYQAFATLDGHLVLAIGNDDQFRRFAIEAGHAEWGEDPRFATNASRVANRAALVPLVAAAVAGRTTDAWIAALEPRGVPCGPINTLDRVFADAQVQARGLRRDMPHQTLGHVPTVASPLNLSATPVVYDRAAPVLGADTADVLGRILGLDAATLAGLKAKAVIG
ncbi:CaiB/BaiF CoA-transferase family protein [Tistrella sp. BH-R2-4]|uniref:CaiB/BaiF CoA-transferase family protein n=1 Tax=Tistrella arctica TaxID=3133430 RepID=A0ABU9YRT3_9PROT